MSTRDLSIAGMFIQLTDICVAVAVERHPFVLDRSFTATCTAAGSTQRVSH